MNGPPAMEPLETPTSPPFSMTMTDLPARTASTAAHIPAPPAPTMAMSHSLVSSAVCMAAAPPGSSPVSARSAAGAFGAHPARAAPAPRAAMLPRVKKLRRENVVLLMVISPSKSWNRCRPGRLSESAPHFSGGATALSAAELIMGPLRRSVAGEVARSSG